MKQNDSWTKIIFHVTAMLIAILITSIGASVILSLQYGWITCNSLCDLYIIGIISSIFVIAGFPIAMLQMINVVNEI